MSYKISDLCPLFFGAREYNNENNGDCHLQVFSTTDKIVLQIISTDSTPPAVRVNNLLTGSVQSQAMLKIQVNPSLYVHQLIKTLPEGCYNISVGGNLYSCDFCVTDNAQTLANTALIEYWHSSNNSAFDALFWNGTTKIPHYLRIFGGFKSGGVSPKLSGESYRTQKQEIRHLYAVPYTTETITFGTAEGLPSRYADKINRIFCVDNVRIDGVPYARNDQSVPQAHQVGEDSDRYWITLDVERQADGVEGIGGMKVDGTLNTTTASGVSFSLSDDIEHRSILQYDKNDGTWKDTTRFE